MFHGKPGNEVASAQLVKINIAEAVDTQLQINGKNFQSLVSAVSTYSREVDLHVLN